MYEKCAEVSFVESNSSFIFECLLCQKKFLEFKYFKRHFLLQHVKNGFHTNKVQSKSNTDFFNIEKENSGFQRNDIGLIPCEVEITDLDNDSKNQSDVNSFENSLSDEIPLFQIKEEKPQLKDFNSIDLKQFVCEVPKCDGVFIDIKRLEEHKYLFHTSEPERKHKCSHCLKAFLCVGALNSHVKTVHLKTIKRFECLYCTKSFKDYDKKNEHEKIHKGLRAYNCNICEKRFRKKEHLKLHVRRNHLKEKRFKCSFCEKEFFDSGEKLKHERVHTGEKPYVCEICSKSFTVTQKLKNHMNVNHPTENPKYECNKCEKKFFTNYSLSLHSYVHQDRREFMCEVCSKCFGRRTDLKHHLKIHNRTEKDFICKKCAKGFVNRNELIMHWKHVCKKSIPTFFCNHCSLSFKASRTLTIHMNKEHLNQSYNHSCDLCVKSFKLKKSLKVHIKKMHNTEIKIGKDLQD